jgi:predicted cupin superfamily sugar epimerase
MTAKSFTMIYYLLTKAVHDAHFIFYCTLSSLDTWHHTRHLLPHDRTLIRQWAAIYRQGKYTVLKLGLMPNTQQATQMIVRGAEMLQGVAKKRLRI